MFPFDIDGLPNDELMRSLSKPELMVKFQELLVHLKGKTGAEQLEAVMNFVNQNLTADQVNEISEFATKIPPKQMDIVLDQTNRYLYEGKPSARFTVNEAGRNAEFQVFILGDKAAADEPSFVAFADVPDKDFVAEVDQFLAQQSVFVWQSMAEMQAWLDLRQKIMS